MSVQLVSKISDLCDPDPPTSQTDGQTDRQTTCDRNTALCTKVRRAVKTDSLLVHSVELSTAVVKVDIKGINATVV